MRTNVSWSIDDSRNKFQFGCEWGELIENGKRKGVVKNPNYRGISADVLAQPARCRRAGDLRSAWHAVLRQGRAQPGDPLRPCLAGVPVLRRRGVRRRVKERFFDLADALGKELQRGEIAPLRPLRRALRFRALQPRQGAAGGQRRAGLSLAAPDPRAPPSLGERRLGCGRCTAACCASCGMCSVRFRRIRGFYINEAPQSTFSERRASLPSAQEATGHVIAAAAGRDLVGIYAAGTLYRGFANSLGQRNWHEVDSFNFDWSLYLEADKAVKSALRGLRLGARTPSRTGSMTRRKSCGCSARRGARSIPANTAPILRRARSKSSSACSPGAVSRRGPGRPSRARFCAWRRAQS